MKKYLSIFIVFMLTLSATSKTFATDGVIRIFFDQNITNERLAEMVASGEIPWNVTHLFLSGNEISDLTPLSKLTNLQELSLVENRVTDLTPLSNLTNLQSLNLSKNQITDISSIANLTKLGGNFGALNLKDNQITDLTPLSGLKDLQWLSLGGNPIEDITPLETLPNLNMWMLGLDGIPTVTEEQIEALRQAWEVLINARIPGDVNGDGVVDIKDVLEILKFLSDMPSAITDNNAFDAAINAARVVSSAGENPTINDALEILKYLAGLPSEIPRFEK